MKKILSILAISAICFTAQAQEKREAGEKHGDHFKKGMRHDRKQHQRQMMKDLNLTDAQKSQMKAQREAYKTRMDQLKQNQNMSVKDYNEQKAKIQKEQREKMMSVLTPDQRARMAQKKAEAEQQRAVIRKKKAEKMKSELSLSNEQAEKLKAHNEATHRQLKAIKENESLGREEKIQQMKAVKEKAKEQRKSILTAEQQKKWDEKRRDRDRNRNTR